MKEELEIWVLVFEKVATLEELEKVWNFDDLLRALAVLEYKNLSQEKAMKKHGNSSRASD